MLLLLTSLGALAQQEPQYAQYMYNTVVINPAFAGYRGATSFTGIYRSQWAGMEGAPRTLSLTGHGPTRFKGLGIGASVVRDEVGVTTQTNMGIDISYTVLLAEKQKLSFGLKAGGHLLDVDFSKLNLYDPSDPRFENNIDNKFSPQIGAGVYYHTPKFFMGFSIPNFMETNHFNEDELNDNRGKNALSKERLHYYLITGYLVSLSENIKFEPILFTRMVNGAPLKLDVSANFMFYDRFSLGAAYRWDTSISGLVGFKLIDELTLGFAYGQETTALGNKEFNDGSFEVLLRYEIFNKNSTFSSGLGKFF